MSESRKVAIKKESVDKERKLAKQLRANLLRRKQKSGSLSAKSIKQHEAEEQRG